MPLLLQVDKDNETSKEGMQDHGEDDGAMDSTLDKT